MLSLIYVTYRPGGFDLLVDGLKDQKGDYELIVIDDYPGRDLTDYLKGEGVPLSYYGPSKPHCYPNDVQTGYFNACNTALFKAKGDVIVFCQDYTRLPPGTIEHWTGLFLATKKIIVCGAHVMMCRGPEHLGKITIWTESSAAILQQGTLSETWIPTAFDLRCVGYRREFLEATNGFDERNDCHYDAFLTNIPWQASMLGYQVEVDRKWPLTILRHDHWGPERWWHASRTVPHGRGNLNWDPKKDLRSPNCFSFPVDDEREP